MTVHERPFGRALEDFVVGDVYRHWPGKTITESEDHLYCLLTLAGSPLHIDSNYAKNEMPEGKNLVVGTFIYALLTGMSVNDISGKAIASLGVKELQHLLPVFHGDTIYASTEILEKRLSKSKKKQLPALIHHFVTTWKIAFQPIDDAAYEPIWKDLSAHFISHLNLENPKTLVCSYIFIWNKIPFLSLIIVYHF